MGSDSVKRFQLLQEERIKTFNRLDEAHKAFLLTAPKYEDGFDDFKKQVSQATDTFKRVSKEIILIKENLLSKSEKSETKLGNLIGKVQDLEEKKIQTVVDLQLAVQQALDNPGDDLCEKNARLIRAGLTQVCEEITDTLTEIRYEAVDTDPPA